MKTKSIATLSKLGFMAALLLVAPWVAKGAFGISPPWIRYDYLKPGTTYSQTIVLSTDDTTNEKIIKSSLSGDPELTQWIKIESLTGLRMPKGAKSTPITVRIEVPKNAKAKKYSGNIALSMEGADHVSGLSINLGANIKVDVAVTNADYSSFQVKSIKASSVMEKTPLIVDLQVDNQGNTSLSEVPVSIEIWSENEKTLIKKLSGQTLSNPIPAYTTGASAQISIDNPLPAGNYWARAKVVNSGKTLYQSNSFLALAPFALPSSSVATSVNVGTQLIGSLLGSSSAQVATSLRVKSPYETPLLIASLLLAALLVGAGLFKFKKHHNHHR